MLTNPFSVESRLIRNFEDRLSLILARSSKERYSMKSETCYSSSKISSMDSMMVASSYGSFSSLFFSNLEYILKPQLLKPATSVL